ncbi:MAG: hypothetical protein GY940_38510, partial [bacterium]|nr:hypothetical protein [bacterium]
VTVTVPGETKSGTYISYTAAANLSTGKTASGYGQHFVTGLSAALNSYTLQEKYFDNETVSGRAEITPGTGELQNAVLSAEIIKYISGGGTTRIEPGYFARYNKIRGGTGKDGMLYLFTQSELFQYDPVNKNFNLLLEIPGFEIQIETVYFDSGGVLWLGTSQGVYMRDGTGGTGTWAHFTYENGLVSNLTRDIIEYRYPDGTSSIWVGSYAGISEYKEGNWYSHTVAEGLPS